MVQLSKSYQTEPEIRNDLQGRIEVFDQNIRSFEKRLRAVERRLSLDASQALQAGKAYSAVPSDSSQEVNFANFAAESSVTPQGPSVSPEVSFPLPGNSLLSDFVPSFTEEDISSFAFGAVLPSSEASNASMTFLDSSSEISGASYRVKDISVVFFPDFPKAFVLYTLQYPNFPILCMVVLVQSSKDWRVKSGALKLRRTYQKNM